MELYNLEEARKAIKSYKMIYVAIAGPLEATVSINKFDANFLVKLASISDINIYMSTDGETLDIMFQA